MDDRNDPRRLSPIADAPESPVDAEAGADAPTMWQLPPVADVPDSPVDADAGAAAPAAPLWQLPPVPDVPDSPVDADAGADAPAASNKRRVEAEVDEEVDTSAKKFRFDIPDVADEFADAEANGRAERMYDDDAAGAVGAAAADNDADGAPPPLPPVPAVPPGALGAAYFAPVAAFPGPLDDAQAHARAGAVRDLLTRALDGHDTALSVANAAARKNTAYRDVRARLFARKTAVRVDNDVFDAFARSTALLNAFASGRLFDPAADNPDFVGALVRRMRADVTQWCALVPAGGGALVAVNVAATDTMRGMAVLFALARLEADRVASEVADVEDLLAGLHQLTARLANRWGVRAASVRADECGTWEETLRNAQRTLPRMEAALRVKACTESARLAADSARNIAAVTAPLVAANPRVSINHPVRRWPDAIARLDQAAREALDAFGRHADDFNAGTNDADRAWFEEARAVDDAALRQVRTWADATQRLRAYVLEIANRSCTAGAVVVREVGALVTDLLTRADIARGRVVADEVVQWATRVAQWDVTTLCLRRREARANAMLAGDAAGRQVADALAVPGTSALSDRPRDPVTGALVVGAGDALPADLARGPPDGSLDAALSETLRAHAARCTQTMDASTQRAEAAFGAELAPFAADASAGAAEWNDAVDAVVRAWGADAIVGARSAAELEKGRARVHERITQRVGEVLAPVADIDDALRVLRDGRAMAEARLAALAGLRASIGGGGGAADVAEDLRACVTEIERITRDLHGELDVPAGAPERFAAVEARMQRLGSAKARVSLLERNARAAVDLVFAHCAGYDACVRERIGLSAAGAGSFLGNTNAAVTAAIIDGTVGCAPVARFPVPQLTSAEARERPDVDGAYARFGWTRRVAAVYPLFQRRLCVPDAVFDVACAGQFNTQVADLERAVRGNAPAAAVPSAGARGRSRAQPPPPQPPLGGDPRAPVAVERARNAVAILRRHADSTATVASAVHCIQRANGNAGELARILTDAAQLCPELDVTDAAYEATATSALIRVYTSERTILAADIARAAAPAAAPGGGAPDAETEELRRANSIVDRQIALRTVHACILGRVEALGRNADASARLARAESAAILRENLSGVEMKGDAPEFDAQERAVNAWATRTQALYRKALGDKAGYTVRLEGINAAIAALGAGAAGGDAQRQQRLDAARADLEARRAEAQADAVSAQQRIADSAAKMQRAMEVAIQPGRETCAALDERSAALAREVADLGAPFAERVVREAVVALVGDSQAPQVCARAAAPERDTDVAARLGAWSPRASILPHTERAQQAVTDAAARFRGRGDERADADARKQAVLLNMRQDASVLLAVRYDQAKAEFDASVKRVGAASYRYGMIQSSARLVSTEHARHRDLVKEFTETQTARSGVEQKLATALAAHMEPSAPGARGDDARRWNAAREAARIRMARHALEATHPRAAMDAYAARAHDGERRYKAALALLKDAAARAKDDVRGAKIGAVACLKTLKAIVRKQEKNTAAIAAGVPPGPGDGDGDDDDDEDGDDNDDMGGGGGDGDADDADDADAGGIAAAGAAGDDAMVVVQPEARAVVNDQDDVDVAGACRMGHRQGTDDAAGTIAAIAASDAAARAANAAESEAQRAARIAALIPPPWVDGVADAHGVAGFRAFADAVADVPRATRWDEALVPSEARRLQTMVLSETGSAKAVLADALGLPAQKNHRDVLEAARGVYGSDASLPAWEAAGRRDSHRAMSAFTVLAANAPVVEAITDARARSDLEEPGVAPLAFLRDAVRARDGGRVVAMAGHVADAGAGGAPAELVVLRGGKRSSTAAAAEAIAVGSRASEALSKGAQGAAKVGDDLTTAVKTHGGKYDNAVRATEKARRAYDAARSAYDAALREADATKEALLGVASGPLDQVAQSLPVPDNAALNMKSASDGVVRLRDATRLACMRVRKRMDAKIKRLEAAAKKLATQTATFDEAERKHRAKVGDDAKHAIECVRVGDEPRARLAAASAFVDLCLDSARRASGLLTSACDDATAAHRRAAEELKGAQGARKQAAARAKEAKAGVVRTHKAAGAAADALDESIGALETAEGDARARITELVAKLRDLALAVRAQVLPAGGVAALLGGYTGKPFGRIVSDALRSGATAPAAAAADLRVSMDAFLNGAAGDGGDAAGRRVRGRGVGAGDDAKGGAVVDTERVRWNNDATRADVDEALAHLEKSAQELSTGAVDADADDRDDFDADAISDTAKGLADQMAAQLWARAGCCTIVPPMDLFDIRPPQDGRPYTDAYTLEQLQSRFVRDALSSARTAWQACGGRGRAADPAETRAAFVACMGVDDIKGLPVGVNPPDVVASLRQWLRYASRVCADAKTLRRQIETEKGAIERRRLGAFTRGARRPDALERLAAQLKDIPGCAVPVAEFDALMRQCETARETVKTRTAALARIAVAFEKGTRARDGSAAPPVTPDEVALGRAGAGARVTRIKRLIGVMRSSPLDTRPDWEQAAGGANPPVDDMTVDEDALDADAAAAVAAAGRGGGGGGAAGDDDDDGGAGMDWDDAPATDPTEPDLDDTAKALLRGAYAPVNTMAVNNAHERARLEEVKKLRAETDARISAAAGGRGGGGGDNGPRKRNDPAGGGGGGGGRGGNGDAAGRRGGGGGGGGGTDSRRAFDSILPQLIVYIGAPRDSISVVFAPPSEAFAALRLVCVAVDDALKRV